MLKSSKHKGKAKIYPQVKMTDTTRSSILSAFTPSGLSILLGLLLVFVIVGGGIGYFAYKGSGLERDVAYYQNAKSIEAEENIDTYFDDQQEGIRDNRFLSNIPLLFFWGAIGLIAYLTVSSLVMGVGEVDVFVRQLDFVNASRAQRIKEAVLHLAVRVSAAIALLLLLRLFIRVVLPYTLALTHIIADGYKEPANLIYIPLAVATAFAFGHILAVLARFITLKTRVFG